MKQVKYKGISNGMKCPLWRLDRPKASEGRMFNWCYSSFAGAKNATATHSLYWKISALWSWTQQDTPGTGLFDEETGSTAKDWLEDLALIRELSQKQIKPKKSVRPYHRRCSCELCVPLIRRRRGVALPWICSHVSSVLRLFLVQGHDVGWLLYCKSLHPSPRFHSFPPQIGARLLGLSFNVCVYDCICLWVYIYIWFGDV